MVRVGGVLGAVLIAALAAGAQESMQIAVTDGLVSIEADRVGLGALLDELDRTAGTMSAVPGELRGVMVSVGFGPVLLDEAIERIFAGLAIDYAVVGDRIVVLAASQSVAPTAAVWSGAQDVNSALPERRGAFAAPGVEIGEAGVIEPSARGRGGRGFEQLLQVAPTGPSATPGLPGLGAVVPFGVSPDPPGRPRADQPAPGFIGNTAPAILDLNQPPTAPPGPGTSPLPVSPGPQSNP
jgi:hypothetical protein